MELPSERYTGLMQSLTVVAYPTTIPWPGPNSIVLRILKNHGVLQ